MRPRKSQPFNTGAKTEVDIRLEAAVAARQSNDDLMKITATDGAFMGGGDTPRIPMLYMDPLFDQILVLFPQDNIRELNRRLRHYYKYNPYIHSIIDFHTETPISDFELRCPESDEAQDYYKDYKERVDLFGVCVNALRDYWLLGESFHYGNWDDTEMEFSSFAQYPPEEVEVHSAYISDKRVYSLRPNKEISKMLQSVNPADSVVADYIRTAMPNQARAIMNNQPHVLHSSQLLVMQRTMAGYINRGVSPLLSVVKDLMYEDFLNMYRTIFIQRHSYPLKLFKLGSEAKGFIPSKKMFAEFRAQLMQAVGDPDFNLVTHPFVTVDYVTGQDKILQMVPMYELVKQRIFAGLFVSEAVVSGEKTPYAAGITFMKGLMNRYLTVRNQLELEIKRKVFYHLARARKFYMPSKADVAHHVKTRRTDERLIIPDFFWKKANLLSNQAIMQMAMQLRDKKEIPMHYIAEMMGWDIDDIIYGLKREEGTRLDPKWRKAVDDAIAKDPELAKKLVMGDDIDEALKAKFMEHKQEPPQEPPKTTPAKGRSDSKEFKLPEGGGGGSVPLPPPSAEGGKKGPETENKTTPASEEGGGLPERKPRPNEQEGGGTLL